jgi:hypothetical protein
MEQFAIRLSFRIVILAAGAVLLLALSVFPAAARPPSPRTLCKALLATPLAQSQLPAGFRAAKPVRTSPSSRTRRHHVVCEVEIDFRNGKDAIFYIVFPTRLDALGNFKDGLKAAQGVVSRRSAPSLPQPAVLLSGRSQGVGFTTTGSVMRNVNIAVVTTSSASGSTSGNETGALALATFAVRHLTATERRL